MDQASHIAEIINAYDARFKTHYGAFIDPRKDMAARNSFPVHITASLFPISHDRRQCLLIHHKTLNKWIQPGGHVDPGETIVEAAMRECLEETGIAIRLPQTADPISIDLHRIPENARKQEPEHYHLDIRYIGITDDMPAANKKEVHDARWFDLAELDRIDERIRPRLTAPNQS